MIYADKSAGIIVTGATGRQGAFHIALMNEDAKSIGGTGVVAGVTPGKGGQEIHGVLSTTASGTQWQIAMPW